MEKTEQQGPHHSCVEADDCCTHPPCGPIWRSQDYQPDGLPPQEAQPVETPEPKEPGIVRQIGRKILSTF